MKPEAAVQKAILDYAIFVLGIRLWRRNVGALRAISNGKERFIRFGQAGMSDLEGITRTGRHVEIECKAKGKTPTPEQHAWLEHCRDAGAIAFFADSLDMFIDKWEAAQ